MNSFTISGIPYRVLDMDVERGGHTPHNEPHRSFTERALEAANQLSYSEKQCTIIIAYSMYGQLFLTSDPYIILRLSLAGEVYNKHLRRMTLCGVLSVLYRDGDKFYAIDGWELRHFKSGDHPFFLNPQELTKKLSCVFKQVKLTLGALTARSVTCPAWQIDTEKGKFFIPWHSGMILENSKELFFEEKEFDELKNAYYSLLSFSYSHFSSEYYKIRCC